MEDVIFIESSVFREFKIHPKDDEYSKLHSKIVELFQNHTCFMDNGKLSHNELCNKKYNKYLYSSQIPQKERNPIQSNKYCSYEREIMAMLNKISKQNYDIIQKKIIRDVNNSNLNMILSLIIQKAFTDSIFLGLYIELIQKMFSLFPSQTNEFVKLQYDSFYNEFSSRLSIISSSNCGQYDDFCAEQKEKRLIESQNRTFISLMKNQLLEGVQAHEYLQFILDKFSLETLDNYQHYVLLQCVHDFYKYFGAMLVDEFKNVYNNLEIDVKIKCKFLDIFDTLNIKVC